MLIVLNLLIILFILAMVAMWSTYGFFSAFLHLVIVIVSGVFAFAVWEPLAYMLLGQLPEYAWGVALLAPFALSIIIVRALMDKFCKMNLKFPRLADQIGGGVCGAGSGILSIGMLVIGIGFLPVPPDLMGYKPYRMAGNDVEVNDEAQLWGVAKVDRMAGNFFTMLSRGAMAPTLSDTSLAVNKSAIAERSAVYRLQDDPNQMKSAHPDSIKVLGVYGTDALADSLYEVLALSTVRSLLNPAFELPELPEDATTPQVIDEIVAEFNRRRETDEEPRPSAMINMEAIMAAREEIEYKEEPTGDLGAFFMALIEARVTALLDQIARTSGQDAQLFVVDTEWSSDKPGTYNKDGWLRIAIPQIRLQTVKASTGADFKLVPPIGYSIEINKITGERVFVEILSTAHFAAYAQDNNVKVAWVFALPPGENAYRFEARQLGFDLAKLSGGVKTEFDQVLAALGASEVPKSETTTDAGTTVDGGTDSTFENNILGTSGAIAELSERLPQALSPNAATSITPNRESDPWTALEGRQVVIAGGVSGRTSRMQDIYVPSGSRLLRVKMDSKSASSLYGRARELAANLQVMQIRDTTGNSHDAIAWVLLRKDKSQEVAIRYNQGRPITASELPRLGPDDELYVYFQVPVGRTLNAFTLGSDVQDMTRPIEVTPKGRR